MTQSHLDPSRSGRVLVLTTVLPSPGQGGGEALSLALLDALAAAGLQVHVVGFRRDEIDLTEHAFRASSAGARSIESAGASARERGTWFVRSLAGRVPVSLAKYTSRTLRDMANEIVATWRPDLVVVDHLQAVAELAHVDLGGAKVAYMAHNVESDIYRQTAAATKGATRWLHRREARLVAATEQLTAVRADEVWTFTRGDAGRIEALTGAVAVRTLPAPPTLTARPAAKPSFDIGLLGTWTWAPNRRGLQWFLDAVMDRLDGDITVAIGGRGLDDAGVTDPRIRLLGRVPDAATFLGSVRTIALPVVDGSGIQVKTLDAAATGVPLVATPQAFRGIEPVPSWATVIADADGFAAALGDAVRSGTSHLDAARQWDAERRDGFERELRHALVALGLGRKQPVA
ncbi:MAG: glycosyltransferase [Acidimicrobiia bacterium]